MDKEAKGNRWPIAGQMAEPRLRIDEARERRPAGRSARCLARFGRAERHADAEVGRCSGKKDRMPWENGRQWAKLATIHEFSVISDIRPRRLRRDGDFARVA